MLRRCMVLAALGWTSPTLAQTEAPPPSPDPGPGPPPATQPAPVQPAPVQPAPVQPAPAQPPPAQPPPAQPAPVYAEPPPPSGQAAYTTEEPPLPEPEPERKGGGIPDFGVRVDPLNWLLFGRMGLEVELELLEWLTAEAVPVFVTNREPVLLPDGIAQESDGLGPLSGVAVDLGIWLSGDSFNGNVIRAGFGNYSYRYESDYGDALNYAEQQIFVLLGSHRTWSWFTIAGAFGLTYETNDDQRCFLDSTDVPSTSGCDDGEVVLRTNDGDAHLNSSLYPYGFTFRFSLGVAIDD